MNTINEKRNTITKEDQDLCDSAVTDKEKITLNKIKKITIVVQKHSHKGTIMNSSKRKL